MTKEGNGIGDVLCTLSPEEFEGLKNHCLINEQYHPILPSETQTALDAPPGSVTIYQHFMYAGLRFPLFPFIPDLLDYYKIHISQLVPNVVRKIIGFLC